ncbi:DUF1648 domain-containing protein [Clostridium tarantellae]|uniref:DUF1648 domain-containing protein n=1 Tax=Clostridium tarantellae TaxID=39493 RepID=A0A6I1MT43_9CLOT|nr:DUF1648 domain-containing protein [Clostridium tarantellae]MPQ45302.1 DUF1648 domain-containing protein [Clostridium tarantellae]
MKIKREKFDIILNVLCLIILISISLFLIVIWSKIPDKVPMHHDFAGNIDRWGSKLEIIILPISAWIMYIFFAIIEKFPQVWNTGVKVTEENKERVYAIILHLISTIKFILVCVFMYFTVQTALAFELSVLFLPIFFIVIFGNLLYWIWKLFKVK